MFESSHWRQANKMSKRYKLHSECLKRGRFGVYTGLLNVAKGLKKDIFHLSRLRYLNGVIVNILSNTERVQQYHTFSVPGSG